MNRNFPVTNYLVVFYIIYILTKINFDVWNMRHLYLSLSLSLSLSILNVIVLKENCVK